MREPQAKEVVIINTIYTDHIILDSHLRTDVEEGFKHEVFD